jgi:hypothetical protein
LAQRGLAQERPAASASCVLFQAAFSWLAGWLLLLLRVSAASVAAANVSAVNVAYCVVLLSVCMPAVADARHSLC